MLLIFKKIVNFCLFLNISLFLFGIEMNKDCYYCYMILICSTLSESFDNVRQFQSHDEHDSPQVPQSDEHQAGNVQEVAGEISTERDDQVKMSEQNEG